MQLNEIFPGATQTETAITIPKATLPTLTATANNGGDALVVGLLLALSQVYDSRALGATAPVLAEPLLPILDWWTTPPTKVWTLAFLFRQVTGAEEWQGAAQMPEPLSADPPLRGRGGGDILPVLVPIAELGGRGGGDILPVLVPIAELGGRGGGDVALLLQSGGDDRTWLIEVTGGDWSIDPDGGLAEILLLEV